MLLDAEIAPSSLDGWTYRMNQTTIVESIFDIKTCRPT